MVLGIYGAGGAGRETKEIAEELLQWDELVFIDDTVAPDAFKGIKRMPFKEFQQNFDIKIAEVVIALGEPAYKLAIYNKVKAAGYKLGNVIHKSAWVSPTAVLGEGIILRAGVIINADSKIGDNVTIHENSCIGHDTVINNHCQIAMAVNVGGHSEIGENTYIGAGVPVKEGLKIGKHSVIGIGSAVLRDIPDNVIAMGNPARAMQICDDNSRVFI